MKRIVMSIVLAIVIIFTVTTLVFAKVNDLDLAKTIVSILRYDFKIVKVVPDNISTKEMTISNDGLRNFEPIEVSGGWLYDLANGGNLEVIIGSLEFDDGELKERYIDIKGENGEVRLLHNSSSFIDGYNKTLFWSFKQQEGASIVKGSIGEVKSVVLFESVDGSCYLYGYLEGNDTDFRSINFPQKNFYFAEATKADLRSSIEKQIKELETQLNISENEKKYLENKLNIIKTLYDIDEKVDAKIDFIKNNLKIGLLPADVENLLENNFTIVYAALDGQEMWRYDIFTIEDYVLENEYQTDSVDLDGILEGEISIQLFVGFDNDKKVSRYIIYYLKDKRVIEYRVFSNGSFHESVIR
ncbi:hypothetical protein BHU72_10745 [Desulfuribacillus stibiiarsenatis]|uniref:Uncharacterized protein n=1 Tax=Desulfuribacillus stibiiarsenatis TaxID=1390249 RepID=A0A1E5L2F4_9FIRM|nr:hypothetical protein [Desulfuribacillus stibiiarsenatis]OEH84284.1 hypothetical protein BHU72_10745 [Desulfuribacillus stibiiarsenatis]